MKAVPEKETVGGIGKAERNAFMRGILSYVVLPAAISVAAVMFVRFIASLSGSLLILPTDTYLALHSTIEILTITISAAIFMLGWYSYRSNGSVRNLVLANAFLCIAIVDLMHTLSYKGMPRFVTESGTSKAIYYWLVARFVQAVALVAVSMIPERRDGRSKKLLFISLALSITALAFFAVSYRQDSLPPVFEAGIGLTVFKVAVEYLIMAVGSVALAATVHAQRKRNSEEAWSLVAGMVFFIFSEFSFTLYSSPFDPNNLLGHILKLASMALLFKALVQSGVERPYRAIESSEKKSKEALARFTALFESAPDAVFVAETDSGKLVDCNRSAVALVGRPKEAIVGMLAAELHPEDRRVMTMEAFKKQAAGELLFVETEVLAVSGKRIPVEIYSSVVEQGGARYLIGTFRDISERKRFEEALRQSLELMRETQSLARIGGWEWNLEKNTIYWTEETYRIHDFAPGDIEPSPEAHIARSQECYRPEDRPKVMAAFRRCAEIGEPYDLEFPFTTVKGREMWIRTAARAERVGGRIVRVIGNISDITERKRMEEELLRASESRYRALFFSSRDAVMTLEPPSWRFTSANPSTLEMFGMKNEKEFLALEPWRLSPRLQPDGRESEEKAKAMIEKAMREGRNFFEWTHRRADGEDFPTEVLLSQVEHAGKPFLHAVVRDISERKKVEAQLKEYEEERFKVIFDNANDGMILVNAETKELVLGNRAFCRMSGYDQENIKSLTIADIYPKEFLSHVIGLFERRLAGKYVATDDTPLRRKDGVIVYVDTSSSLVTIGGSKFVLDVFRDITERREVEERDRKLDELKDQFIRLVSHQLRTPLSAVRWGLEEVMGGEVESTKEMVRMAYDANREVIARISDMVVALEIERGKMRLERQEACFEDLVAAVCQEFAGRAAAKGVKLNRSFPPKQRTSVVVDTDRLSDAMRRLVDNAISYSDRGDSVGLDVRTAGKSVRFTVVDTGIGVSDESKSEIFLRFYRGTNAMNVRPNASGLGLYIAKHIVEAHGGKIGFESEEDKGSTFWFEIPKIGK